MGGPFGDTRGAANAEDSISAGYSRYVLFILFLVYVVNFIDRQVLAMLLEPIKQDLGVSDTLMGLLSGFAFALFYTFAGIPIARWADTGSRRSIITLGLAVWSVMTAACGLAQNFVQLAVARIGVGIGEAAGTPPAHSLISDYFPPERRGTALSVYSMGVYVGAMFAFLAGGYLREYFDWRTAFFIVALPGLPLALLLRFTVREPERGRTESGAADAAPASVRDVVRFLSARRSFVFLVLAACFQSLSGYGVLAWGPTFFGRVHGMDGIQIGIWLGLIIGFGGAGGAYLGGAIADRLGARDSRWYLFLSAIVCAAGIPFVVAFALAKDVDVSLLCFIPYYVLTAMYVGPMLSIVQGLVKLRMRAMASAILLFILNLVGLGFGPFLIGLMNDAFADRFGAEAIRYSLLVVGLAGLPSLLLFQTASRTLREDLAARDA